MSDTTSTDGAFGQPTALDNEAAALIKSMEAEFDPGPELVAADDAAPPPVQEDGLQTSEPTPDVTAGQIAEGGESKGKPAELSEFVAREIALFRREEALRAKEAQYQTLEQELTSLRKRNLPEDVVEGLRYQTSETLRALGIDPDTLVKQVLADRLGDKAPEDLRAEVKDAAREFETNRKIRALENKLAEQERAERARVYFSQVQDGAREYLDAPGVNEHAPTVAKVAKSNKDLAFTEIMAEIQRDAEFKAMRDPSAPLITYEEAATRLEKRWSTYSKVFTPQVQNVQEPKPTQTPAKIQPTPQATTNRPLAPWLQKQDVEEDGLKAAIAEFHRSKG